VQLEFFWKLLQIWKHFPIGNTSRLETFLQGPTEICEGVHQGIMKETGVVEKRGPKGDAKTSPAETPMDSAVKPNKSKNYNPR